MTNRWCPSMRLSSNWPAKNRFHSETWVSFTCTAWPRSQTVHCQRTSARGSILAALTQQTAPHPPPPPRAFLSRSATKQHAGIGSGSSPPLRNSNSSNRRKSARMSGAYWAHIPASFSSTSFTSHLREAQRGGPLDAQPRLEHTAQFRTMSKRWRSMDPTTRPRHSSLNPSSSRSRCLCAHMKEHGRTLSPAQPSPPPSGARQRQ